MFHSHAYCLLPNALNKTKQKSQGTKRFTLFIKPSIWNRVSCNDVERTFPIGFQEFSIWMDMFLDTITNPIRAEMVEFELSPGRFKCIYLDLDSCWGQLKTKMKIKTSMEKNRLHFSIQTTCSCTFACLICSESQHHHQPRKGYNGVVVECE